MKNKYSRSSSNYLGKKRLLTRIPVGSKFISVYKYETGQAIGLCELHCSLFEDISRRLMHQEEAIERAHKLQEFYNRQTTLVFD